MPRRPLDHLPRITCNDACHKKRGSEGGTDYLASVGTPVYAMFSGMARYRIAGTGGWTVSINRENSTQIGELMHLSRANGFTLGGSSRHVNEGDLVAWSGGAYKAPGAGSSTGPHLHAHVYVDGVRYGMEEYLANSTPAGGDITPIEAERKRTMRIIQNTATGEYWRVGEFTVLALSPSVAAQEATLWGNGIAVDSATAAQTIADAQRMGAELVASIAATVGSPTGSDNGPVLAAVKGISDQVAQIPTTHPSYAVSMTATPK